MFRALERLHLLSRGRSRRSRQIPSLMPGRRGCTRQLRGRARVLRCAQRDQDGLARERRVKPSSTRRPRRKSRAPRLCHAAGHWGLSLVTSLGGEQSRSNWAGLFHVCLLGSTLGSALARPFPRALESFCLFQGFLSPLSPCSSVPRRRLSPAATAEASKRCPYVAFQARFSASRPLPSVAVPAPPRIFAIRHWAPARPAHVHMAMSSILTE